MLFFFCIIYLFYFFFLALGAVIGRFAHILLALTICAELRFRVKSNFRKSGEGRVGERYPR